MGSEYLKLSFVDRIVLRLAIPWIRGKLEVLMAEGWKGKTGAIGVMITGAATLCYGLACMVGEVTGNPISGVPCPPEGCSLQVCISMIMAGFGTFSVGFSQYGNRVAITKIERKLNGGNIV